MHQDIEEITTIEEGIDYEVVEIRHSNGTVYRQAVLKGDLDETEDYIEAYERAMRGL